METSIQQELINHFKIRHSPLPELCYQIAVLLSDCQKTRLQVPYEDPDNVHIFDIVTNYFVLIHGLSSVAFKLKHNIESYLKEFDDSHLESKNIERRRKIAKSMQKHIRKLIDLDQEEIQLYFDAPHIPFKDKVQPAKQLEYENISLGVLLAQLSNFAPDEWGSSPNLLQQHYESLKPYGRKNQHFSSFMHNKIEYMFFINGFDMESKIYKSPQFKEIMMLIFDGIPDRLPSGEIKKDKSGHEILILDVIFDNVNRRPIV